MENQDMVKALKAELRKRTVKFKYTKKDGSVRDAEGTLNMDIMGSENAPNGNGYEAPENQVRYFDTNSNGWRSFLAENLISYE